MFQDLPPVKLATTSRWKPARAHGDDDRFPLKPVANAPARSRESLNGTRHREEERLAARGVRRRPPVVHLAVRAAAGPRLPLVHLGLSLEEMRGTRAPAAAVASPSASPAAPRQVFSPRSPSSSASRWSSSRSARPPAPSASSLMERLTLLGKIAGVVLIIFGLHTMGVLRSVAVPGEARPDDRASPPAWSARSLVGIAFAFGWTPCIGPILGGILALAAIEGHGAATASACSPSTRSASACRSSLTSLMVNQFFRRSRRSAGTITRSKSRPAR